MAEAENIIGEPGIDGATQLVEFACKEMIDSLDDSEMVAAR